MAGPVGHRISHKDDGISLDCIVSNLLGGLYGMGESKKEFQFGLCQDIYVGIILSSLPTNESINQSTRIHSVLNGILEYSIELNS
jgi:hypothetical protein